jgi:hypothetical protein
MVGKVTMFVAFGMAISTIVVATGCSGKKQESAKTLASDPSPELRRLMIEHRDVLKQTVEAMQTKLNSGLDSVEAVYEASIQLVEAELALATTREERLAALKANLEFCQKLELRAQDYQKAGLRNGDAANVLRAKANRLKAEIRLLRETSSRGTAQ